MAASSGSACTNARTSRQPNSPRPSSRAVDLAHELQVLRRIDRPAQAAVVAIGIQADHPESPRRVVEVGQHVLALMRFDGLAPRSIEGGEGNHLDIQADGIRARPRQPVDDQVGRRGRIQKGSHGEINQCWIDQRTVRGQADDDVGPGFDRCSVKAIQYVLYASTEKAVAAFDAQRFQRVVRRVTGRGDDPIVDRSRTPGALERADEHRHVGDLRQNLAGQAR